MNEEPARRSVGSNEQGEEKSSVKRRAEPENRTFKVGSRIKVARTTEYQAWHNMIERCRNPRMPNFHRYGGRGISVCEKWKSFDNFLKDMGRKGSPNLSLDRIDNDGNYEPGNCRWATPDQQNSNKEKTLTFNGIPIKQIAELIGVSSNCVSHRIKLGINPFAPKGEYRRGKNVI